MAGLLIDDVLRKFEHVHGEGHDFARGYVQSKSLELAFLLPTDPLIDVDFEIMGTQHLAAKMHDALKHQQFSPSVQSDAQALLNSIDPNVGTSADESENSSRSDVTASQANGKPRSVIQVIHA